MWKQPTGHEMTESMGSNGGACLGAGVVLAVADQGARIAAVRNAEGRGSIGIQGAQILSWAPAGQAEVIWLSPVTGFRPGESLRGGAPVCWPWFGPHPQDPSQALHGFARILDWELLEVTRVPSGTRLALRLPAVPAEKKVLWPHEAEVTLTVTLGKDLSIELATRNTGADTCVLTQGIHTYFRVGDIAAVRVEGLAGYDYIDKTAADARIRQRGPVLIEGEVNRIYLDCAAETCIVDEALGRRIQVTKQGSDSYVLWNPWAAKAASLGDMGEDGYRRMLCLETTNAYQDRVRLPPGASHRLSTCYRVAPI